VGNVSGSPRLAGVLVVAAPVPLVAARAAAIPIGQPPMPEPEATQFVRQAALQRRVLVWFDWGEYAIWYGAPGLRVSIDGRRETVYSERLIQDHIDFYLGSERALDLPSRISADYIWLPTWIPSSRSFAVTGGRRSSRGLNQSSSAGRMQCPPSQAGRRPGR
jgi:hypothetical protein